MVSVTQVGICNTYLSEVSAEPVGDDDGAEEEGLPGTDPDVGRASLEAGEPEGFTDVYAVNVECEESRGSPVFVLEAEDPVFPTPPSL